VPLPLSRGDCDMPKAAPGGTALHDALAQAFRRLPLAGDTEAKMSAGHVTSFASAAGQLAMLHISRIPPDTAFRPAGNAETTRQLDALAKAAAAVTKAVEALNAPAIDALADRGLLRHHLRAFVEHAHHAASAGAPQCDENPGRGRAQSARHADGIIISLALFFRQWTGREATRISDQNGPRGDFFGLAKEVFSILGCTANPDEAIRRVMGKKGS
jgi:hypothetical protein